MTFQSIQVPCQFRVDRINLYGHVFSQDAERGHIQAMNKKGGRINAPFGGFIDVDNIIGLKRVKLVDISALCTDEKADEIGYAIPHNHYTVGTYLQGQFYILLYEGEPKHYLAKGADTDTKGEVYRGGLHKLVTFFSLLNEFHEFSEECGDG